MTRWHSESLSAVRGGTYDGNSGVAVFLAVCPFEYFYSVS